MKTNKHNILPSSSTITKKWDDLPDTFVSIFQKIGMEQLYRRLHSFAGPCRKDFQYFLIIVEVSDFPSPPANLRQVMTSPLVHIFLYTETQMYKMSMPQLSIQYTSMINAFLSLEPAICPVLWIFPPDLQQLPNQHPPALAQIIDFNY